MIWMVLAPALLGHWALWIMAVNVLHGTAIHRKFIKAFTAVAYAWMLFAPVVFLAWLWTGYRWTHMTFGWLISGSPWGMYIGLCWAIAAGPLALWLLAKPFRRRCDALVLTQSETLDLRPLSPLPEAGAVARGLLSLPFNEIRSLEVNEKTLRIPGLPASLEGFAIGHASDLHLTGVVAVDYFCEAIARLAAMEVDCIALTGDYVDRVDCIGPLANALKPLAQRDDVFFVLGNHDVRYIPFGVREAIAQLRIQHLGGRNVVLQRRGEAVLIAGNEVPWFRPTPPVDQGGAYALRILLTHTPDQIYWARRQRFDLVLAGHNHGGQIALPALGPIVAPSLYGVKFAGGVFQSGQTVMHVSRGISGQTPIRIGSMPEVTRLVLTGGK